MMVCHWGMMSIHSNHGQTNCRFTRTVEQAGLTRFISTAPPSRGLGSIRPFRGPRPTGGNILPMTYFWSAGKFHAISGGNFHFRERLIFISSLPFPSRIYKHAEKFQSPNKLPLLRSSLRLLTLSLAVAGRPRRSVRAQNMPCQSEGRLPQSSPWKGELCITYTAANISPLLFKESFA